jgi:protein-tyrosine phosphatase
MSTAYIPTWITKNLAVGHAPMSYEELDSLKDQGINAIVNLCGEFTDLHEIEEKAGFEVFYLPIDDNTAPKLEEMEKGLAWLDEAMYLGKKVLVHCHHGIGRTGTFVTAYLLRRGLGMKKAGKKMKSTRANPTNFSQWWLLRKFGRKEGVLTASEPTPENRNAVDLSEFYTRYERLLDKVDGLLTAPQPAVCCAPGATRPCGPAFTLEFIEALYLNDKVNIALSAGVRQQVIKRAAEAGRETPEKSAEPASVHVCPLHQDDACLLHRFRPIPCRLRGFAENDLRLAEIRSELDLLSRQVFSALFNHQTDGSPPAVSCPDSISGKFIQEYFHYLASQKTSP